MSTTNIAIRIPNRTVNTHGDQTIESYLEDIVEHATTLEEEPNSRDYCRFVDAMEEAKESLREQSDRISEQQGEIEDLKSELAGERFKRIIHEYEPEHWEVQVDGFTRKYDILYRGFNLQYSGAPLDAYRELEEGLKFIDKWYSLNEDIKEVADQKNKLNCQIEDVENARF